MSAPKRAARHQLDADLTQSFYGFPAHSLTGSTLAGVRASVLQVGEAMTERLDTLRGYDEVWQELPPETLHARPETMQGLIQQMNDRWGGFTGYVKSIGIQDEEIEQFRERSLE